MQWKTRFSPHDTHGDWIVLDGGETVCYVLDYGHARLIAKAPAMHDVLRRVAAFWAGADVPEDLDRDIRALLED